MRLAANCSSDSSVAVPASEKGVDKKERTVRYAFTHPPRELHAHPEQIIFCSVIPASSTDAANAKNWTGGAGRASRP
jgi:hypothetical protein